MAVHVYVSIIICNLVYRRGKKALSGAKSQFLFIGQSHLELLSKYLLSEGILRKGQDLITLLNSVVIHNSLIWQMLDIHISLDQKESVLINCVLWLSGEIQGELWCFFFYRMCLFLWVETMHIHVRICVCWGMYMCMSVCLSNLDRDSTIETGNLPALGWSPSFSVIAVSWSPHVSSSARHMVEAKCC